MQKHTNAMVKHVKTKFTFSGIVNLGPDKVGTMQDTNATMEMVRKTLLTPGLTFKYNDKGYGTTFTVNDQSGPQDCAWGPVTERLHVTPMGSPFCLLVEWVVVVCIPECAGSVTKKALMAFNYGINYEISKFGMHTITISGSLEIPLTFWLGQRLSDNADAYRERLAFPTPLGFERNQNYRLSQDRRRLEFTIIDRELEVPYPESVVNINLHHEVSNQQSRIFASFGNRIYGTIHVDRSQPKSLAWDTFIFLASKRIIAARSRIAGLIARGLPRDRAPSVILTRLKVSEEFGVVALDLVDHLLRVEPLNDVLKLLHVELLRSLDRLLPQLGDVNARISSGLQQSSRV